MDMTLITKEWEVKKILAKNRDKLLDSIRT